MCSCLTIISAMHSFHSCHNAGSLLYLKHLILISTPLLLQPCTGCSPHWLPEQCCGILPLISLGQLSQLCSLLCSCPPPALKLSKHCSATAKQDAIRLFWSQVQNTASCSLLWRTLTQSQPDTVQFICNGASCITQFRLALIYISIIYASQEGIPEFSKQS